MWAGGRAKTQNTNTSVVRCNREISGGINGPLQEKQGLYPAKGLVGGRGTIKGAEEGWREREIITFT